MSKLIWIWSNRDAIAASLIAFAAAYSVIIATPLSRLIPRPPPSAHWAKRLAYDLFIDTPSWLAALEHSGILGGVFNVPGVPSRAPEANPTPAASKLMQIREGEGDVTVPPAGPGGSSGSATIRSWAGDDDSPRDGFVKIGLVLGIAGMLAAGCGTAGGKALKACELGQLSADAQPALALGQAIATDPSSTVSDLETAALKFLPGQFECAIQALIAWWGSQPTSTANSFMQSSTEAQAMHARDVLQRYAAAHKPSACGARQRL